MHKSFKPRLQIEAIVATDLNGAIGKDGTIPWELPSDLARFRRITLGSPVLMGTGTALSIGKRLPGRLNLVLTRSKSAPYEKQIPVASIDDAIQVVDRLYDMADQEPEERKLFIAGGEEVYKLALPRLTGLHLTAVQTEVEGADRHFPVREFYDAFVRTKRAGMTKSCTPERAENMLYSTYMYYDIRAVDHAEIDMEGVHVERFWPGALTVKAE